MDSSELHIEKDLFQQVAQGNEKAFRDLVENYGPQLEKAIFQVIQAEYAIKDILQDVFLHIWLDREKFANLANPRTWVFRIAYYRSYSWLRHAGVREKVQGIIENQQSSSLLENQVEEHSSFKETKKYIQEAIQQLTPQGKRIYLLSWGKII